MMGYGEEKGGQEMGKSPTGSGGCESSVRQSLAKVSIVPEPVGVGWGREGGCRAG
jgi:hypothetical protein